MDSSQLGPGEKHTDVLVLCYHAVSPRWPVDLSVTPEGLSRQIEYLCKRGYQGTTFTEGVQGQVRGKSVAITFDDAYASVARIARPILDRYEMPATVFVPTDYLGGGPMSWPGIDQWPGTEHEQELMPMTWDEARELADAGWEIGSHTKSHPHLSEVPDDQLDAELSESRQVCEQKLDRPCTSLAYPFGDYDERVIAAAGRAGYLAAGTFPSGWTEPPTALAWPRLGIFHHDSFRVFRLKLSPAVRGLRRTSAWMPLVEPLRRISGR